MKWCGKQNARAGEDHEAPNFVPAVNCCFVFHLCLALSGGAVTAAAPATRRGYVQETLHVVTISDPYRWLEDQESTETRAWINQQNEYTHKLLDSWPGRARLEKRLSE